MTHIENLDCQLTEIADNTIGDAITKLKDSRDILEEEGLTMYERPTSYRERITKILDDMYWLKRDITDYVKELGEDKEPE